MKLIHMADLHLDSPFDALPDALAAQRRQEQRALLQRMAELCRQEAADAVLLAGDLLDGEHAYYETTALLREVLAGLSVPVFISPGNHDHWSPRSPWAAMELPENVHLFNTPRISCVELGDAVVWGAGFGDVNCPPLLTGFSVPEQYRDKLNLMVIHGDLSPNSRYNPITQADIAQSGLDYLALGHIHKASGLCRAGDSFYAWPGCPEGRGFDECGEKGLYVVELEKGRCALRFVPLGGRRYEILDVDVSGKNAEEALKKALPADAENNIFRLILRGEVDTSPDLAALERALSPLCFGLQLRDRTEPLRDLWAMAEEDTLKGLFLRRMRAKLEAAEEEEREKLILAARFGLAALENREEPVQ